MIYNYKGIDKFGQKISSSVEAKDENDAKIIIKNKGIIYTSLELKIEYINFSWLKIESKIRPIELSNISRDLSIYLDSNVSLLDSIKLINNTYKHNKKFNAFFQSLATSLEEGQTFYNAIEKQSIYKIPQFYKQSIKVSETSGFLSEVLLELSKFLKNQDKISKQISSAMIYPTFILVTSFFMVGFMLSVVVPSITSVFSSTGQKLPDITVFVISLGEFVNSYYDIILLSILFIISVFIGLMRLYLFRYFVDKMLLKVPFVSTLIEHSELSRFSYINSILIKSNIPTVQAFKLSSDILKNEVLKKLFTQASQKVVEGKTLSSILESNNIYKIDNSFTQAIAIGEETSKLPQILTNLAVLYQESNSDKINILLSLIEPLFMLIVGGIIGAIVLSMLLPIFSMSVAV